MITQFPTIAVSGSVDAKAILVQLDGKRGFLSEKEDTRDELRSKTTHLKRQLAKSEKKREGQLLEKTRC